MRTWPSVAERRLFLGRRLSGGWGNARQEGHWIAVRKVVQLRDYTIDADGLPRIAAHVASWPVLTDNLISRAKMPAASTMGHVGGSATPTEDTWRWSDPEDYRLNSGV